MATGGDVTLTANTGTGDNITITNTQGTAANAIDINATAGGIDIDAAANITIDTTDTSNGVKIATVTSGVPVTIGHTTSEVSVGQNLTVTGDLTVSGNDIKSNGGTTAITLASNDVTIANDLTVTNDLIVSGKFLVRSPEIVSQDCPPLVDK